MKKMLINPFFMFGFTFFYVILAFNFNLSKLYAGIENTAINLIFSFFILICMFVGTIYNYTSLSKFNLYIKSSFIHRYKSLSNIILIFGFILECANNGGIPLIMVLKGAAYDYTQFGIKTFHVFFMGYLSASVIINFERFLRSESKYYLITPCLGIIITILIMNRGATFLLVFPMGLMYLAMLRRKLKIKHIALCCSGFIVLIILFGILGDKRMLASGYNDQNIILDIGKADPFFHNLPSGFFWTYLYSTSPFANLNLQINVGNIEHGNIDDFIAGAILPDFISKYSNPNLSERFDLVKVTPELNVGTGFSGALIIFGISGVIVLFIWFLFFNIFFIYINKNGYLLSACATLTAMAIFMSFNNTLIFSSCVLQLIFVTMLSRFRINRRFVI